MLKANEILEDVNKLNEIIACWYSDKIYDVACNGDNYNLLNRLAEQGIYKYDFYVQLLEKKLNQRWNTIVNLEPGALLNASEKASFQWNMQKIENLKNLEPKPKYIDTRGDKPLSLQRVGQIYIEKITKKTYEELKEHRDSLVKKLQETENPKGMRM
ncbi:hypothetical protein [Ureaplasma diversum]|uniref:Uncharacterized protein n=1 Tax=Ureaplasma diversum NCTC 246 TaxID=1188241 RepID=A0A084EZ31_9BACT|nr:hypothetical protein [Ureaplasma diversum]KEZ23223.1 hypothetical protein UDIV_3870 [Ureaplasma diversum NCTC 246]